ncbi:RILP-like protein 2 isoform X2 [Larus michahellis]|uniref:RILP-like protein 2 isoform X2 n=1 Tax=Larus michahellis TaxID=119627 RepID=UPI003D9B70CD
MQQGREEEELEEEEEDEGDGGPERALEKSPFQLTAGDVYDISSLVGRDLLQLGAGPRVPAALARLQFRIVRVLEMLEALVSESSLAEEQLRAERDSLRRELEALRAAGGPGGAQQKAVKPFPERRSPSLWLPRSCSAAATNHACGSARCSAGRGLQTHTGQASRYKPTLVPLLHSTGPTKTICHSCKR